MESKGDRSSEGESDAEDEIQRAIAEMSSGKILWWREGNGLNEVRRWAQETWRGAQNIQVNGYLFLYEFQTRAAEAYFNGGIEQTRNYSETCVVNAKEGSLSKPHQVRLVLD
ncbi:hypothetical protein RND71_019193 [Anisodus tanguticus]|uniref:Uncharacterized protein n=1 Tax=Anisodus tanguticus TaxID=243964 RepID=A0AAE1RYM5_9SOLA|nr:hypothetical protein RND71_019193 [Anisodus tanguticus]